MRSLAEAHPHYGWERNMGYGTREHLEALRRHGPAPCHRRSFAPVAQLELQV
jgi:ribonuclease HII